MYLFCLLCLFVYLFVCFLGSMPASASALGYVIVVSPPKCHSWVSNLYQTSFPLFNRLHLPHWVSDEWSSVIKLPLRSSLPWFRTTCNNPQFLETVVQTLFKLSQRHLPQCQVNFLTKSYLHMYHENLKQCTAFLTRQLSHTWESSKY